MTDIISMLAKAQNESNSRQTNDSVASFFNSIGKHPSTNGSSATLPIQIKQSTLESIERNIPNQDTQNNNASQNDLQMANSPLAMFLSSNFSTSRPENNGPVVAAGSSTPPGFIQSQKVNGNKEATKLITPNMLAPSNNNNSNADKKQTEPLTKNQMIQALKYLIENDDDFTKKVHDAYLKSVNSSS